MTAAITALAVSTISAGASAIAGSKSRKAQRRANDAQKKINQLKNLQQKRQFLRQYRQAQSAALIGSVGAGVGLGSSRSQAAMQSQLTQKEVAVAEFAQMDELGGEALNQMNKAAGYQGQAATWGAIGNLATSFIAFGSGTGDVGTPGKAPGVSGTVSSKFGTGGMGSAGDLNWGIKLPGGT